MVDININFGGFYGSDHSDRVDSMLDSFYNDEDGEPLDYSSLDIDYSAILNAYISEYMSFFVGYIKEVHGVEVKFHSAKLVSPPEYNFSTDFIFARISNRSAQQLSRLFKEEEDEEFEAFVLEGTTSRDGYIPFYTKDQVWKNKDDMLTQNVLDFLVEEEFEERAFDEDWDTNSRYEMIFDQDLPELKQ